VTRRALDPGARPTTKPGKNSPGRVQFQQAALMQQHGAAVVATTWSGWHIEDRFRSDGRRAFFIGEQAQRVLKHHLAAA